MQATARFHDDVTHAVLQEPDFVFHDPIAFHPTNSVFNAIRVEEMRRLVAFSGGVSSAPRGFFLGWTILTPARTNPWKPTS
jgi:hypothetical protein